MNSISNFQGKHEFKCRWNWAIFAELLWILTNSLNKYMKRMRIKNAINCESWVKKVVGINWFEKCPVCLYTPLTSWAKKLQIVIFDFIDSHAQKWETECLGDFRSQLSKKFQSDWTKSITNCLIISKFYKICNKTSTFSRIGWKCDSIRGFLTEF